MAPYMVDFLALHLNEAERWQDLADLLQDTRILDLTSLRMTQVIGQFRLHEKPISIEPLEVVLDDTDYVIIGKKRRVSGSRSEFHYYCRASDCLPDDSVVDIRDIVGVGCLPFQAHQAMCSIRDAHGGPQRFRVLGNGQIEHSPSEVVKKT